jgi:diacylglycerol O-acyltransferase
MADLRHPDRDMSPFDAWLYRGDANPRTRALLGALYVLDRAPDRDRVATTFERASRLAPRLRQRVVSPPLPFVLPSWIVDPDFDLGYHLRTVRIAAPGGMAQLLELLQADHVTPLDPDRPLWTATLVEGLPEGRGALLMKMSHAVSDGMGSASLFGALFDDEREPEQAPMPPEPIPEDVTPDELLRETLRRAPAAGLRLAGTASQRALAFADRLIADPRAVLGEAGSLARAVRRTIAERPPNSPVLAGRSLARRAIALEAPLEHFKRTGKATGASVNDVYLAGICGALRLYHEALAMPVESLPIALPVNLRHGGDVASGNHFGAILLAAPLAAATPRERLALVRERVLAGRSDPAVAAPVKLAPLLSRLPAWALDRLADGVPRPDIQASSFPGPRTPLFFAGSQVQSAHAFGPVPGVAAMFTMLSAAGTAYIGVNLDPAAVRRPDLFADCIRAGFDEVLKLGSRRFRVTHPVLGTHVDAGSEA